MIDESNPTPEFSTDNSSNWSPPEYAIDPADQHIADEILSMDFITDVAGPVSVTGDVKLPEPSLSTLPPAMRERIEAQLVMVPASQRDATTKELINKELRSNAAYVRSTGGVHPSSTPYHHAHAEIAREYQNAAKEFNQISDRLVEVLRFDSVWDDVKGESVPVPVFAVSSAEQRKALVNRQAELNHRLKLLRAEDGTLGPEAVRRVQKALHDSVALRKAAAAQAADQQEIEKRANEKAREAYIERQSDIRAKMKDRAFHS